MSCQRFSWRGGGSPPLGLVCASSSTSSSCGLRASAASRLNSRRVLPPRSICSGGNCSRPTRRTPFPSSRAAVQFDVADDHVDALLLCALRAPRAWRSCPLAHARAGSQGEDGEPPARGARPRPVLAPVIDPGRDGRHSSAALSRAFDPGRGDFSSAGGSVQREIERQHVDRRARRVFPTGGGGYGAGSAGVPAPDPAVHARRRLGTQLIVRGRRDLISRIQAAARSLSDQGPPGSATRCPGPRRAAARCEPGRRRTARSW